MKFAPEADAMVIQLGVVCTGTVRMKEVFKKVDKVVHEGHCHYQFNTIDSCKVRKMVQRSIAKKKAFRSVSVKDDDIAEGTDSDGQDDDDEEDETMADPVSSRPN